MAIKKMAIENIARVAFRKCFISFATCSFNIFTRESFVFVSFQIRDLVELLERKLQKDSEWKVELSAHCSPDKLYILYDEQATLNQTVAPTFVPLI